MGYNLLKKMLLMSQEELKSYLASSFLKMGKSVVEGDTFLYHKGTVPVLLVAHMNTFYDAPTKVYYTNNYISSPKQEGLGGDDRCGIYLIMSILQEIDCHVLFFTDEEVGGIGAYDFCKTQDSIIRYLQNEINAIIEIDRKGNNEAVFYDCTNRAFMQKVCEKYFIQKQGSFSDISILAPCLDVAAVNVSAGYQKEHTTKEIIDCKVMTRVNSPRS